MKGMTLAVAVLLAGAGALPARGEGPALTPAMEQAMKNLSAGGFAARERAVKDLQASLAEQLRALVLVDDAEAQQRMVAVLEFQESTTRWASEMVRLPAEKRGKLLAWGLKPEVVGVIAKAYSTAPEKRIEGVKGIGAFKDEEASWMLARMIVDERREVAITAIEAVQDRKATDELVAALWQKSVESGLVSSRLRTTAVGVRGRVILADGTIVESRGSDAEMATEALIRLNAPQVAAKIKKTVEEFEKDTDKYPGVANQFMPYNESARCFLRIVENYKTPEGVGFLLTLLDKEARSRQQMTVNTKPLFASNRTSALVTLITITGQKHEEYGLTATNGVWPIPWCSGSDREETDAIAKFKTWYAENKDATTKPAETKPVETKPTAR